MQTNHRTKKMAVLAMLSALARPAGAALRRSFSTSAQVGPARGSLQVEAPWPRPRVFLAREQP